MTEDPRRGPPGPVSAPTRGLTVVAGVLALVALFQVPLVLGPLAMALGLIAHVRGDRAGFGVAIAAGITTVVGMSLLLLFANPAGS